MSLATASTNDPAAPPDAVRAAELMVATPAPAGTVPLQLASTLLDLRAAGVAFSFVATDERVVAHARNALLSAFHARRAFTHLLFLDADVSVPAAGLVRLIAHRRDVVAAPVPLAGPGPDGERRFDLGNAVGESGPLLIVDRAGSAVLLLSRRAAEALVEEAKSDGRVYERPAALVGDAGPRVHYDVFRAGAFDGAYHSESDRACASLRRLGFAIHVDPAVVVRHHGAPAA